MPGTQLMADGVEPEGHVYVVPEHTGVTSPKPMQQCIVGVPQGEPASGGWQVAVVPERVHTVPEQQTAPFVTGPQVVPIGRHAGHVVSQLTTPSLAHVHETDAPSGQLEERQVPPALQPEPSGSVHVGATVEPISSNASKASPIAPASPPLKHAPVHSVRPSAPHAHDTAVPDGQCAVTQDVPTAHAP